jgi:hypothetical protein
MSSIINLKKEILKVVLDSDGDLNKMNVDNIVKLATELSTCNIEQEDNTCNNEDEMDTYGFVNLKKNNMDNLSVFEAESDIIFHRMRKAHDDMKNNERRESIKQKLLAKLNNT